jgi:hypothetical protein
MNLRLIAGTALRDGFSQVGIFGHNNGIHGRLPPSHLLLSIASLVIVVVNGGIFIDRGTKGLTVDSCALEFKETATEVQDPRAAVAEAAQPEG